MMQPAASVAHVLAATAVGMMVGGLLRATAASSGAGTESLLQGMLVLSIAFAAARTRTPPRPHRWTMLPLLLLPAAMVWGQDVAHHAVAVSLAPLGGLLISEGWLDALLLGCALLPSARAARIAMTSNIRLGGAWTLTGLAATWLLPPAQALAGAACLLFVADRTPAPHRGWRSHRLQPAALRCFIAFIATAGAVLGWTALRSVLDPTPAGAAVVIGGALLGAMGGRILAPRGIAGALAWALCALTLLLLAVGAGTEMTDRIGSAAAAWEWGIEGRIWLLLPLLLIGGLAGSAAGAAGGADRATSIGIAAGLWAGPWALTGGAAVIAAGTLAALLALSVAKPRVRILSAAVTVSMIAMNTADWVASPSRMGPGIYDEMRSTTQWADSLKRRGKPQWQAWLPGGTVTLHPPPSPTRNSDSRTPLHVEVDGLNVRVPSRLASAEELAGHLSAMLSPDPTGIIVLGDPTGEIVRGMDAHPTTAVQVAVAYPGLLQTLAKQDTIRRDAWLDPHVHTQRATPQRRLAATGEASGIVEISRTPWTSGLGAGLTDAHLRAVERRLGTDGVYVLCTHLEWWPDGAPAALAAQMAATFEHVQIWLPPVGADSLIWVASNTPIPLSRLATRFADASSALERLGYAQASGLAGTAIVGTQGTGTWAEGATGLPPADQLSHTLFAKPVFHAAGLAGLESSAEDIWDTQGADVDLSEVDAVLQARRMFLALIDDAARGQIGAAFDTARALVEEYGDVGAKTLEPLIDPHIKDAESAIRQAALEGPTSDKWAEAQRFATTARMIAPQSPRPHVILGEVALGRGDVQRAEGHFRAALSRNPKHISGLDGLARSGRLRGDDGQVEQALRATTRHAPQDWRTWHNLGIYLLEKNRLDEALAALKDAAAAAPKDEAAPLIGMAKAYLAKGEPSGALVRAQRATQLDEKNALGWYLRGRAHYDLRRYDEAEQDFRAAVLADGKLVEARGAIGQVLAIRGDYAAAAEQFRAVLTLDPSNVPARENLRRLAPLLNDEAQP